MDFLPDEILLAILKKCSYEVIINVRQTNKRLNKYSHDEILWKHFCKRDYDINSKDKPDYPSFQDFYVKFLRKWGHLIGVYVIDVFDIGIIVEIKYINNALVAEKWESGPRRSWFTSSLDSDILFKISKHPVNGSVETTCHYSKNTSHPCSLKKNLNTRNYMLKCDKYDVHTENTSDPQHYIMLYTHKLSTGISLQPLLLPEKSHIPKELLLKNGSRPEQLIDPGMFQELRSDVRGLPGVYVFHYKNSNELIGNKITGPLPVPPQEMLLKVFLKYSFVASKEDQSSKQNLDNIETKINNNINHVRELPEHEFYPISFPDVFKGTHEINSCKARYHGRGDLRGMPCLSIHELNFSKIHFIVFNNDLIGTVLLSTGNVLYFRRINKSFVKNIPQLDLNYRALQFSNYD